MTDIEFVQEIGNEICEGCGPDADCGEAPAECDRIATAIGLLDDFIKRLNEKTAYGRCE